ncbi:S8 family peptidase [Echinicola marina]|uniref:S8 family peptidase n=1 Tax=Echinicola marina TaxID=2859768 RepID=UPI001CF6E164|nr:S8 family peptidase [Echinicola marina]UCS95030.1 S8 family peptidase [Echinicola marina]
MPNFPHLLFTKQSTARNGFRKTRGRNSEESDKDDKEKESLISEEKKLHLKTVLGAYEDAVSSRDSKRTLNLPNTIELIQVDFHSSFDKPLENHFIREYGMDAIERSGFNKNILFKVRDRMLFKNFQDHLKEVISLPKGSSHLGKSFARIALISNFKLLDANRRRGVLSGNEGLIINICDILEAKDAEAQLEFLFDYLEKEKVEYEQDARGANLIFIKNANRDLKNILADNFDIIRLIISSRVPIVKPSIVATPVKSYDFEVIVEDELPIVAIVDTGIQAQVEPLMDVVTSIAIDHTGMGAFWDEAGHGTAVAGLVALGTDFFNEDLKVIRAKAKLAVLKVIHQENDDLNIVALINDIRDLHLSYGIKIFNISLNLPGNKNYNDPVGKLAYELDKLSYQLDVLIINSVGNYRLDDLGDLISSGEISPNTHYPSFFYDPENTDGFHLCELTNIQEPSEGMNLLSVGALAGNFEKTINYGITPAREFPAFYSRKCHLDFSVVLNGSRLKQTQINKNLRKPDLVMEGGDYLSAEAAMEVLRSSLDPREPFYGRMAGTSLAAPLVTSLAAQLLKEYPGLRMTSVKALLINTGNTPTSNKLPEHFSSNGNKDLYYKLSGYGKPQEERLLANDSNSMTFVLEEEVELDHIYRFPLIFPEWVLTTENKIAISATLVYKFLPVEHSQTGYLPLHMSFGVFKSKAVEVIAENEIKDYLLKSGQSWSEDHYAIEDRMLSNVQQIRFNISSHHFDENDPSVALVIRSRGKKNIPESDLRRLQEQEHPFSLVVSIWELQKNKKSELHENLYEELRILNDLESIADLEAGSSVEGGI